MKVSAFLLSALLFPFATQAALFGEDQRSRVTESSPYLSWARSTAVAVISTNFSESAPGKIKLEVENLEKLLCPGERFRSEPSLSYACTGFLVAPDLIATAGHCMVNNGESHHDTDVYCKAYSWLFDYRFSDKGTVATDNIPASLLYHCKEVIYAVNESRPPYRDFALVRLERPVRDRKPLRLAKNFELSEQDRLTMIGYPMAAPAKVSPGGKVLLNDPLRQSFITNLDAIDGNSGSPVWNGQGKVVGLLVSGAPVFSFVEDKANACHRYNHCDEDGLNCLLPDKDTSVIPGFQRTGSEVQRIQPLVEWIRKVNQVDAAH